MTVGPIDPEDETTWPRSGEFGPIVRSSELTPDSVPADDYSWREFMEFAATFDGYSIYGSSESVFETARVVKRRIAAGDTVLSMSEMRLWTFFEWRAQRHAGPELINDEIRRVLSEIRTMLEAQ